MTFIDSIQSVFLQNTGVWQTMEWSVRTKLGCQDGVFMLEEEKSGPCLNIKTVLPTYGDFHVKDKTAVKASYL